MVRRTLAFALGLGLTALLPSTARAQFTTGARSVPSTGGNTSAAPVGSGVSPYATGYLSGNPLLNPYAADTNTGLTAGNAALYFFAAQQASGGLGSGRMSGSRPAPVATAHPADERPRGTANAPGAGASRFFNRGLTTAPRPQNTSTVPSRQYNRQMRYFPANGR